MDRRYLIVVVVLLLSVVGCRTDQDAVPPTDTPPAAETPEPQATDEAYPAPTPVDESYPAPEEQQTPTDADSYPAPQTDDSDEAYP